MERRSNEVVPRRANGRDHGQPQRELEPTLANVPDNEDKATTQPTIPQGKARLALAGALLNMHMAVAELERTASAIARQLDREAT